MPIRDADLSREFRVFDPRCTLQEALEQDGEQGDFYLVVQLGAARFASVLFSELRKGLDGLVKQGEQLAMLYAPLGELLAPLGMEPVSQAEVDLWQAEMVRRRSPTESVVVIAASGEIAGLLAPKPRGEVVFRSAGSPKGAVLSAGEEPQVETEPAKRINVKVIDNDDRPQKPDEKPLQLSQSYTLVLDITEQLRPESLVADAFLKYKWKDAEQEVTLTVRLESDDFKIATPPQTITVPRQGDSNKARFDFRPLREGRGVINVLFFKEELFIQLLTLKFTVVDGALFSQSSSGRTLAAAFTAPARHVTLTILETAGGFNLIMMTGPVAATATLPISKDSLAQRVTALRQVLRDKIVYMEEPATRRLVYQKSLKIPDPFRDLALRILATEGFSLYREIFYGPGTDQQAHMVGDRLRELARRDETLHVQIFSQHFMMPWGLLYLAGDDEFDERDVHPEWFLGLKHVIEHIPLQQTLQVVDSEIDTRGGLTVSINVNPEIDSQMGAPLVGRQLEYWDRLQPLGVNLVRRTTADELINALRTTQSTNDQIIYFYCHALSEDLQTGGPDASVLQLGRQEKVTLRDLKLRAAQTRQLPGEPLIFINACESAELSPLFYDGFVPYFLDKGARGVIGTECETPALFALDWAGKFFDRFLKGDPLGQIVLDLRRDYFYNQGNLLGLLYALYVDGDTHVAPGLPLN